MADVKLNGKPELAKRVRDVQRKIAQAEARALYEEAQLIAADSRERTPVDTGALRASHVVTKPRVRGEELVVGIEVGGPSAEYAIYVHEDLEAKHPVGEAKFLENAVNAALPGLQARLAERLKGIVG